MAARNLTAFKDNFDDGSIDTNKWLVGIYDGGSVVESNGVIAISGQNLANTTGSSILLKPTTDTNDLTSHSFIVKMNNGGTGDSTHKSVMYITLSYQAFFAILEDGTYSFQVGDAYVDHTGTFDTTMPYVRLRAITTTLYYDKSSDGINWVNVTSATATGGTVFTAIPSIGMAGYYCKNGSMEFDDFGSARQNSLILAGD